MKCEKASKTAKAINNLVNIVEQLRDPINGCPWDIEQTHTSLISFVLEEAHEVTHAIRAKNATNLKEELGDLLLQIILHAQIAKEKESFDLLDIAEGITTKLIRRHPHIFQEKEKLSIDEVKLQWEKIKLKENTLTTSNSPVSDQLKTKMQSQSAINGAIHISNN